MKVSIYALEKLLIEHEATINAAKKQLKDVESGAIHLSAMKLASVENTLERSSEEYARYKEIYDSIPNTEIEKYKNLQRVQQALAKQSYYKLQKIRIKRKTNIQRNQRLEAMLVIDELPEDIDFEDDQLVEVAELIVKYNIREVVELEELLIVIKEDFHAQLSKLPDDKDLKQFTFLDYYIPILILHMHALIDDIKTSIEEYNQIMGDAEKEHQKKEFSGIPKYEDWWISELFKNHQAYFGLYKWKNDVEALCTTDHQKMVWDKVFQAWLLVKKLLNNKEENAYDYQLLFDEMLKKYCYMEEELDDKILQSMEDTILDITKKEDFTKVLEKHDIHTPYEKWKKEQLEKEVQKEEK